MAHWILSIVPSIVPARASDPERYLGKERATRSGDATESPAVGSPGRVEPRAPERIACASGQAEACTGARRGRGPPRRSSVRGRRSAAASPRGRLFRRSSNVPPMAGLALYVPIRPRFVGSAIRCVAGSPPHNDAGHRGIQRRDDPIPKAKSEGRGGIRIFSEVCNDGCHLSTPLTVRLGHYREPATPLITPPPPSWHRQSSGRSDGARRRPAPGGSET